MYEYDDSHLATPGEAHAEWHLNSGVPMGTPGCPQDACHPVDDEYDAPLVKCGFCKQRRTVEHVREHAAQYYAQKYSPVKPPYSPEVKPRYFMVGGSAWVADSELYDHAVEDGESQYDYAVEDGESQ